MKKTLITFLFLLFLGQYHAQIAQWIIPPVYDSIYFANGANLIVTDSAKYKVFWNRNGQRLFSATGILNPFSEGYSVLTNDTSALIGFYDTKGNFASLAKYDVKVANDFPYFSDGNLIIKKKRYYVVDTDGVVDKTKHLRVYPFHNGFAVCHDFENPQKKKGTVRYLMDKNRNEVSLICKDKTYDKADVDFISSVNDEHIAVVIIKKMLFLFDGNTRRLNPLYFSNAGNSKRPTQAKLEGEPPSSDDVSPVIYAQCGKNEQISIFFDNHLVPTDIYYNNEKHHYTQKTEAPEELSSLLQPFEENRLFGLTWRGQNIIPAQFENIHCCHDKKAFAKQAGKQGMLQVNENVTLNLTINNGKNVAFRHQAYESTIQIDMPSSLNPSKIDIKVDPNSGCVIDKISKQTKQTEYGNRAEYTCRLTIPNSITEDPADYDYLIQMTYDNILIMPHHKKVKAWRDMYYDIIINDGEKEIDKKNGLLSFPFTIDIERHSNEEAVHFDLDILPNTLDMDIDRISTTRGICKIPLSELTDGENYLIFELTEQGCPPLSFPFSITYKMPASKSRQKSPIKTDYTIEKKSLQEIKNEN